MPLGSRQAVLEELRLQVAALERGGGEGSKGGRLRSGASIAPFGVAAIDEALPGGLPLAAVHVLAGEEGNGTVAGFAAALAARIGRLSGGPAGAGPVLWCLSRAELYGPGLAALGLDPARLILVQARARTDLLWAMEEGLRCPALSAVVAEVRDIKPKESRRLQLAAEAGGVTGFLLREGAPQDTGRATALGVTGWRVAPAPGPDPDESCRDAFPLRWRLELVRCRGGRAGSWVVDWNNGTGDFSLAAPLLDGPADAARGDGIRAAAG